ncbi:Uncharacterised protein [uncultured archaeon]|nr:Uncharacterised protein [uncultured archaeon]
MVANYKLDRIQGRVRIVVPAFVRDAIFEGVSYVKFELSEDVEGSFVRLRPLRS